MVFEPCFAKTVLDDGGGGFSPRCSNHVCCLHNVKGFEKGMASLLFSTQVRYLSASFFLYLLFVERMIPWSSGCIIKVALGVA